MNLQLTGTPQVLSVDSKVTYSVEADGGTAVIEEYRNGAWRSSGVDPTLGAGVVHIFNTDNGQIRATGTGILYINDLTS